jgi:hypothetical protein
MKIALIINNQELKKLTIVIKFLILFIDYKTNILGETKN